MESYLPNSWPLVSVYFFLFFLMKLIWSEGNKEKPHRETLVPQPIVLGHFGPMDMVFSEGMWLENLNKRSGQGKGHSLGMKASWHSARWAHVAGAWFSFPFEMKWLQYWKWRRLCPQQQQQLCSVLWVYCPFACL